MQYESLVQTRSVCLLDLIPMKLKRCALFDMTNPEMLNKTQFERIIVHFICLIDNLILFRNLEVNMNLVSKSMKPGWNPKDLETSEG